ncbi:MAG: gamma carbonic anhydrase family protein [Chloroflexota bacterium]|nr:MAG: gamma carbonic anhydrase family protein [Chloroflexota bacterium]
MIIPYRDAHPSIAEDVFVAETATVIGNVTLGQGTSVWFGAVLRGDKDRIVVGAMTNIQDNATVHLDPGHPAIIGNGVTVGHGAIVHGCVVEDNCLIGMGAVVLTGAHIGRDSIVGAHALVTEGKRFPPGSLIVGVPARVARVLTEAETERIRASARDYAEHAQTFQ